MSQQRIQAAIEKTLAYSDVFNYPLLASEIHRYLEGQEATPDEVAEAIADMEQLARNNGHYALAGKGSNFAVRAERAEMAKSVWKRARHWGWLVAHIPFVRMLAVTGTLAVDNIEAAADIDFLVVTAPGRLWLCRAMILGVDRIAGLFGVTLCPNYLISSETLLFDEHNLFTARELTQMVPLSSMEVYKQMRQENAWVKDWLPNATGAPRLDVKPLRVWRFIQWLAELPLKGWLGQRLEDWEMERKIARLETQNKGSREARFSANYCKGHFDGHGEHTRLAFEKRLAALKDGTR